MDRQVDELEKQIQLWHQKSEASRRLADIPGIGPITAPIFLTYGLVKGAFLATEAASSLAVYVSKAVVFRTFGALHADIIIKGLITGSSLMGGTFVAKRFVLRLEPQQFRLLMEGLMLISGAAMLWAAAN